MLNEYCKKEKDNEVYLNILYNKNCECNLKKPTTKEIELNNIYKNLKISDWFNPTININFVDVAQDGNCFFRSLSVLIYGNENDYKKIKYTVEKKIIELQDKKDKEFIELCKSIEYVDGRKNNEILEFDPKESQWASEPIIRMTEMALNVNIITITLKKNNDENIYIYRNTQEPVFKPLQKTFIVWYCSSENCHQLNKQDSQNNMVDCRNHFMPVLDFNIDILISKVKNKEIQNEKKNV